MTKEEYKWHINLVKDRHAYYDLTFEQAEQVYRYEQDLHNTYSDKHIFSMWEEWDYAWSVFSQILNPDQLRLYEAQHLANMKGFEEHLLEQDAQQASQVNFAEDRLHYYENVFVPELENPEFWRFVVLPSERIKVDYFKVEYKRFLNEKKRGILVEHFREHKVFRPNLLKSALLRHEVDYLWPNYTDFQKRMDEPTKAVDTYLRSKLSGYINANELLDKLIEDLKAFNQANFQKYHQNLDGWHSTPLAKDPVEAKKDKLMALLLRDRKKYGLRSTGFTDED